MRITALTTGSYEVKETYTNGFASTVYKLEDGTEIIINYDQTTVTVIL